MVFVSLEDPWGLINVVVRPAVYDTYRAIWRGSQLLLVEGVVERREGVVNVIAIRSWPMAQLGCPLG